MEKTVFFRSTKMKVEYPRHFGWVPYYHGCIFGALKRRCPGVEFLPDASDRYGSQNRRRGRMWWRCFFPKRNTFVRPSFVPPTNPPQKKKIHIYLEPFCPQFWWLNPPKQGLFQSKQGSVGFQVYIYIHMYIYIYVAHKLLLIPINFTRKNSHSCLKKSVHYVFQVGLRPS